MARSIRCVGLAGFAFGLLAATVHAAAEAPLVHKAVTGSPKIQAIDVIRFGPRGLLLIGDGRGSQVIAVQTGDTAPKGTLKDDIARIDAQLAGRLGAPAKGIEILDLAVNPASGTAYLAVRKQDDKSHLILTVDGAGKIAAFPLQDVTYARLVLPAGERAPVTKLTDLAWAGDRVLVAGSANEEFACKIFSIPVPLEHEAKGAIYSTETYHVSHRQWETRAPMSTLLPYEEDGKKYLVGSFACTPVVKYRLDDLKPGAKVKGISVVELGSGNRPLRMFTYEKGGRSYVLMNTHRFHHKQKPFGPSPYWTVRFERDLLRENEKVNQQAIQRLDARYQPITDRIQMIEAYHGVVQMDRLDAERALVLREDGKGGFTLAALALP
jgi:hypothetical protein